VAVVAVLTVVSGVGPPARAGDVAFYEGQAKGSVLSFVFHAPELVVALAISGGVLESTVQATATPQGFGTAGLSPVPLASSAGLVVPSVMPVVGTPVPKEVQEAFKSFDFTQTPYTCQANFPAVRQGGDEAFCGGPAQQDTALGFTSATANGHVRASGDFDHPLATHTVAESRAEDASVPGLQATLRAASSQAESGLNADRIPKSEARAEIGLIELLGRAIRLQDIASYTTVTTDGTPEGTAGATSFTVQSATVFGVPVRLGPEGFTVAGNGQPGVDAKALTEQVNKAASVSGFTMRLLPAQPVKTNNGVVSAESGAVEVAYTVDAPTPLRVIQRYGVTQASLNSLSDTTGGGLVDSVSDGLGASEPAATSLSKTTPPETADTITPTGSVVGGESQSSTDAASASLGYPEPLTASTSTRVASGANDPAAATQSFFGQQALTAVPFGAALPGTKLRGLYLAVLLFTTGAALLFRIRRWAAMRHERSL
jgi:hypothetical protein